MPNTEDREFPKCKICDKPVTFGADTVIDDAGNAVHEDCYGKRLLAKVSDQPPQQTQ
jgi:hypothetical protein